MTLPPSPQSRISYRGMLQFARSHCSPLLSCSRTAAWRHSPRRQASRQVCRAALAQQQEQQQLVQQQGECGNSSAVNQVLARLRERAPLAGEAGAAAAALEVVLRGSGRHQGTDVCWQLRWRPADGAFYEAVRGRELSYAWGYDGRGRCWEQDDSGCARALQLDDHEAVLLAGWIRTGAWASAAGSELLDITIDPQPDVKHAKEPAAEAVAAAATASARPAGGGRASSSAVVIDPQQLQQAALPTSEEPAGLESDEAALQQPGVSLAVQLKGGRVSAHVRVCSSSWQPLSMTSRVCSDVETWQFEEWRDWEQGLPFPRLTLHHSGCGGLHRYVVEALQSLSPQARAAEDTHLLLASSSSFSMPPPPLLPSDSRYLPGVPPEVPAWYCPSGHILVQPAINGLRLGYMILDTGASGFVIDPEAAPELGLEAFGELHVTGMAGKVRSNFRRGATFQLGPLLMERPLFMEMSCGGLVRGAPGPLIGIVGYEVFRRAIVDIPPRPTPASTPKASALAVDSGVVSAAAAFAASLAGSGGGRKRSRGSAEEPVQYHIRLLDPRLPGNSSASVQAGTSQGHGSSSSSSKGRQRNSSRSSGGGWGSGGGKSVGGGSESVGAGSKAAVGNAGALASLPWSPLTFIANLPHLEARYTPGQAPGLTPRSALFMLDSGAGGVDVMLNARGSEGFVEGSGSPRHRFIKGVGGEDSTRVKVGSASLGWLDVGGRRFPGAKALLVRQQGGGSGGIELSLYTAGILCGDLLSRCRLVLDYPRSRIAILQQGQG